MGHGTSDRVTSSVALEALKAFAKFPQRRNKNCKQTRPPPLADALLGGLLLVLAHSGTSRLSPSGSAGILSECTYGLFPFPICRCGRQPKLSSSVSWATTATGASHATATLCAHTSCHASAASEEAPRDRILEQLERALSGMLDVL